MDTTNCQLEPRLPQSWAFLLCVSVWQLSASCRRATACPTMVQRECADPACAYSIIKLQQLVQEAAHNATTTSTIRLPFDRAPPVEPLTVERQVVRIDAGEPAVFHCPLYNVTSLTHLPDMVWYHNSKVLRMQLTNQAPTDLAGAPYTMMQTVHSLRPIPHMPGLTMATMSLSVRHFPWSATGQIRCAQGCGPLDETPTTLRGRFCTYSYQIFQLVVLPTAGELFIHRLANATVQRFSDARFECAANTLPNQPVAFIWRFNGHIISAPTDHPLSALARSRLLRRQEQPQLVAQRFPLFGVSSAEQFAFSVTANISTNTANSTLTISQVDLHTSARVECWVRPNADADTWRVQTAYLHVSRVTSAA